MILFPQLPHHIALQIADGARSAPVDVLAGMAAPEHPSCEYTPIGNRSTRTALIKLRNDLLQIAMDAGYPQPPGGQSAADFDARASIVLIQQMPMVPAEAARGGVWAFLACVLLPDIVRWRFSGVGGTTTPLERFVSGRRNVFQRLWWRAFHLMPRTDGAPQLSDLLSALGEDELVQLMERPSIAGIAGLPGSIAAGLLAASQTYSDLTRRQLIREAQKRFLRLSSFLLFESIDQAEIDRHVEDVFEQVAVSLLPRREPELETAADNG